MFDGRVFDEHLAQPVERRADQDLAAAGARLRLRLRRRLRGRGGLDGRRGDGEALEDAEPEQVCGDHLGPNLRRGGRLG